MMNFAALIFAAIATAAPAPPGAATFANVTLGESVSALVAQMGDPTGVDTTAAGTMYTYVTDRQARGYLAIFLDHNNVVEVHATRSVPAGSGQVSALGITLGAPDTTLAKLPPADTSGLYPGPDGLLYQFTPKDGVVYRIVAALAHERQVALAPSAAVSLHGGTSFADAIVIGAADESSGVTAEYAYLDLNRCPGGGAWKTALQSLVTQGGKPYDVLNVVCSTGGAKRSFTFDISRFFGKI